MIKKTNHNRLLMPCLGVVFALCLAVVPAAPVPAQTDGVERYLDFFNDIVFGSEFDPKLKNTVVAKWQGPVRIALKEKVTPEFRKTVVHNARMLSVLSGLDIRVLEPGEKKPNLYMFFVPRREMTKVRVKGVSKTLLEKLSRTGGCYFLAFKKPPSRIILGVVVVNIERKDGGINHCILEELTQTLGLPNDSNAFRPSLFSDKDKLLKPSRADVILLKTLYHPRLKPGLPHKQALQVARGIIADLDRALPKR